MRSGALSIQMKLSLFFNLAQMCQGVWENCSPVVRGRHHYCCPAWEKGQCLRVFSVSFQKSSLNSLQLPSIFSEDLFKSFGGWLTHHWQFTDGELYSARRPSKFCKKAVKLFPHAAFGPVTACRATRWQPPPGTGNRLSWRLNWGSRKAGLSV